MRSRPATTTICTVLISIAIAGCSVGTSNEANSVNSASNRVAIQGNSARTNLEELSVLVNFPYTAEDVVWKEVAGSKRLIAVLRLSPTDSAKLIADVSSIRSPTVATVSSETWFPPELIAQGEMSGDDSLKGMSYAANNFLQPPYTEGLITRIDRTDYFVLDVAAK